LAYLEFPKIITLNNKMTRMYHNSNINLIKINLNVLTMSEIRKFSIRSFKSSYIIMKNII